MGEILYLYMYDLIWMLVAFQSETPDICAKTFFIILASNIMLWDLKMAISRWKELSWYNFIFKDYRYVVLDCRAR